MLDISAFINEYQNMIEFTFAYTIRENVVVNYSDPNDPNYVTNWAGFRAQNH